MPKDVQLMCRSARSQIAKTGHCIRIRHGNGSHHHGYRRIGRRKESCAELNCTCPRQRSPKGRRMSSHSGLLKREVAVVFQWKPQTTPDPAISILSLCCDLRMTYRTNIFVWNLLQITPNIPCSPPFNKHRLSLALLQAC